MPLVWLSSSDGDAVAVGKKAGKPALDRVVEPELPLGCELQDHGCRPVPTHGKARTRAQCGVSESRIGAGTDAGAGR
jgi:hypothetical protein